MTEKKKIVTIIPQELTDEVFALKKRVEVILLSI
jgi:hypothetical protein